MNDEKLRKILWAVSIFLSLTWLVVFLVTVLVPIIKSIPEYGLPHGLDIVMLFLTIPFVFLLAMFLIRKYARSIKAYTVLSILVIALELVYAMSLIALITGVPCC